MTSPFVSFVPLFLVFACRFGTRRSGFVPLRAGWGVVPWSLLVLGPQGLSQASGRARRPRLPICGLTILRLLILCGMMQLVGYRYGDIVQSESV